MMATISGVSALMARDLRECHLGELDAHARLERHPDQRVAGGRVLALPLDRRHPEVAVVVEVPDDEQGDVLLLGGHAREPELPLEVIVQVGLPGERRLVPRQLLVRQPPVRGGGVALELVLVEVLVPVDLVGALLALHLLRLLRRLRLRLRLDVGRLGGAGAARDRLLLGVVGALEQGVLGHLGPDEVDELHSRELQELDGLLQLGRHHQLLRHPEVLLQLETHGPPGSGCGSSRRKRSPRYTARARSLRAISAGVPASRIWPAERT